MVSSLRQLIAADIPIRVIGVHDELSALLAENAGFEALWAGGLGISTSHGVPDAGILTMTELQYDAARVRRSVNIPVIADVDAGFGDVNVVRRMIKLYESSGINAVCIEDKQYPKRNSFLDGHVLEDPVTFACKIQAAKETQQSSDFMIIARLESLIAKAGMDDAVCRALLYAKAGADAILIHSKRDTHAEIEQFVEEVRTAGLSLPIFAVPTTYHSVTANALHDLGIAGIIYANQLIRSSVTAMRQILSSLADTGRTTAMEPRIATVQDLFDLTCTEIVAQEPVRPEWLLHAEGSS